MKCDNKHTSVRDVEQMTPTDILAEGWRLTRATLALKGLEIPDAVQSLIDSARQVRATRFATLEELARELQLGLAEPEGPAGRRRATAPRRQVVASVVARAC
jgi:hypothetical protein